MEATLSELRRDATKVVRPVLAGHKVTITEHGQPRLEIVPATRIDRKAALAALRAIGPVELPPRK